MHKQISSVPVYRTRLDITFDLSHEQDELIREVGNAQRGGHEDLLPEFLKEKAGAEFTEYLKKRKEELRPKPAR